MYNKILIIDDDPIIRDLLNETFNSEEFKCREAISGEKGLECVKKEPPNLIILDINLKGVMTGWDVLKVLKQNSETANIPVIVITGQYRNPNNAIDALTIGADDYVLKPFSPRELMARGKAILRRLSPYAPYDKILRSKDGRIVLDKTSRTLQVKNGGKNPQIKEPALTPREYQLVVCFLEHPNEVLTRERLTLMAWDEEYFKTSRSIDKHMQTLRSKLGTEAKRIETITGIGYKFNDENM